ncbi:hypothetical protein BJP08_08100 [Corynebacterium sp. NML140438]|uniref:hypothetical protein n=1 Tax=Corynebacterium sp. NML140438 TaxID=1906334 RepID=UPI0008FAF2AC|nr:hypothetical protein [Corynebacterium sp. NML140438]OIR41178.1 hypothetical protein BJP08_08100 [Corynebacterium sp. NML140438]
MTDYSIRGAREWAQGAKSSASPVEREAAKALLDLLPEPTMAELEWDDDAHHLAGATTPDGHEVVMMWHDVGEEIICNDWSWVPDSLTPNGKKYRLVEDPDHPTILKTEQDFKDAPLGTIVARAGSSPWVRNNEAVWLCAVDTDRSSNDMAYYGPWTVLRWGRIL